MYANEELRMSNAAPRVAVGRTTVATRGGGGWTGRRDAAGNSRPFQDLYKTRLFELWHKLSNGKV